MDHALPPGATTAPPGRYIQFIILFASMFSLLAGGALAPALPGMKAAFAHGGNIDTLVKMQLSTVSLFIAIGAPLAGLLSDRLGRRAVFLLGVLMTACCGTAAYWMPSLEWMLVTRALLGLGVACSMTSATTLVGDLYTGAERERFVAVQGAAMKIGGILFTLIGGLLASIEWRAVFLIDLLALVVLPGVITHVANTKPTTAAVRPASGGLGIPMQTLAVVFGIAFLGQVFFYMLPTQLPFVLMSTGSGSAATVSYVISASIIASALCASQYHRVRQAMGYYTIAGLAFLIAGAGYAASAFATGIWTLGGAMVLAGLGFGLVVPNVSSWILSLSAPVVRGRAVGLLLSTMFLGQFFSPLLWAPVVARVGLHDLFWVAGLAVAAVGVILFLMALVRGKEAPASPELARTVRP